MRVVNGTSSRYVVRGLGFCDLNGPDIFRRGGAIVLVLPAIVIKLVRIGCTAGHHNTDANLPIIGTNLCQRFVEVTLVLPLNVCPCWSLSLQLMSKLDRQFCVRDEWKIAAADDRNDRDYAEYNKAESYR